MSTKQINPPSLGQPGSVGELPHGPNGLVFETLSIADPVPASTRSGPENRLSSDDLITIKCLISDRINRVDACRLFNGEVGYFKMGKNDPYHKRLIALCEKLPKIISDALVVDLELRNFEETPKFAAALRLISDRGIWFSHECVRNQKDLYLSLQERGYYWSKTVKKWLIRQNINADDDNLAR